MADPAAVDAYVRQRLQQRPKPRPDVDEYVRKKLEARGQTTPSIAPQPASLAPPQQPDAAPIVVSSAPALPQQPPDEDIASQTRDWQGALTSGITNAIIDTPLSLASIVQSAATMPFRDEYPEGTEGFLGKFGHNMEFNEAGEPRALADLRRDAYDVSTQAGEFATDYSPMSLMTRLGQAMGGDPNAGHQDFGRDLNAQEGEFGYVSPAKEILPDVLTAAVPLPGTQVKLLQRATDAIPDVPKMLERGARLADNLLESTTAFSMPGTKSNMAINAGVTGAVDEGLRFMTGDDTLSDAVTEYFEQPDERMSAADRALAGVKSSGLSGYSGVMADIASTGVVQ